jgi:hypothetical protein
MASQASSPATTGSKYDNYVDLQLEKTRARIKMVDLCTGIFAMVGWVLGVLLFFAVVDSWIWTLGTIGRTLALIVLLGGLLGIGLLYVLPLFLRKINPRYAARMIEQARPKFKNSLLNYLWVKSGGQSVHASIASELSQQAAEDIREVSATESVDQSHLIRTGFIVVALSLIAVGYSVFSPKNPLPTVARVMNPFSDISKPAMVRVSSVEPGDADIFFGDTLLVTAEIHGRHEPHEVQLVYSTDDGQHTDVALPMISTGPRRYEINLQTSRSGIQQNLKYRVVARDGESPWYAVTVKPLPAVSIETLKLVPPKYTGIPERTIVGTGEANGVEGTRVFIEAKANLPIQSAYLEFLAPEKGTEGSMDNLRVVKTSQLDFEERSMSGSFLLTLNAERTAPFCSHYQIRYQSDQGDLNSKPNVYPVRVTPDLSPEIKILEPRNEEVVIPSNGALKIQIEATDVDYEISSLKLQIDHKDVRILNHQFELPKGEKHRVTQSYWLVPEKLSLRPGDKATFFAVAADNRHSPYSELLDPNVTRTDNFTIIISEPDERIDEKQRDKNIEQAEQEQKDQNQEGNSSPEQEQTGEQQNDDSGSSEGQEQNGSEGADEQNGNQEDSSQEPQDGEGSGQDESGGANDSSQNQEMENQSGDNSESGSQEQQDGNSGNSEQQQSNSQQSNSQQNQSDSSSGNSQEQSQDGSGNSQSQNSDASQEQSGNGNSESQPSDAGDSSNNSQSDGSPNGGDPGNSQSGNNSDGQRSNGGNDQGSKDESLRDGEMSQETPDGDRIEDMMKYFNEKNQKPESGDGQPPEENETGEQSSNQDGDSDPDGKGSNSEQGQPQDPSGQEPKDGQGSNEKNENQQNEGDQNGSDQGSDDRGEKSSDDQGQSESGDGQKQNDSDSEQNSESQGGDSESEQMGNGSESQNDPRGESNSESDGSTGDQNESSDATQDNQGKGDSDQGEPGSEQEGSESNSSQETGDEQSGDEGSQAGDEGSGEEGSDKSESGEGNSGKGEGESSAKGDAPKDSNKPPQKTQSGAGGAKGSDGNSDDFGDDVKEGTSNPNENPNAPIQSSKEFEQAEREKANLDYAKNATDLLLENLRQQAENPDPEFLERNNWTPEELRDFLKSWEQMRDAAKKGGAKEKRRYESRLKSLGLKPKNIEAREVVGERDNKFGLSEDGAVNRPSAEWTERYNRYMKQRNKAERN